MSYTGGTQNGVNCALLVAGNVIDGRMYGKIRMFTDRYDMVGALGKSETIMLGYLPKDVVPLGGWLGNSASLGTSVVSVGILGTLAKYRTGATKTSITREELGLTAAYGVLISTAEEILLSNDATAALPTSGIITLTMTFGAY